MEQYAKILYGNQAVWCKVIDDKYYPLKSSIFEEKILVSYKPVKFKDEPVFLPPCEARKVIALAYNYKGLVGKKNKYDEPLIFFKSLMGLIGHKAVVSYPPFAKKVWQEVELTVVIKKRCKNVSLKTAAQYVLGYTCGNDITCENILSRDWHLARSKGLDTFCPLGPFLVKGIDPDNLALSSYINGKTTQSSSTADMIISARQSVALVSKYFTLEPGDVILTGTPAGATDAVIRPGDTVTAKIESIGTLINYIKKEKKL